MPISGSVRVFRLDGGTASYTAALDETGEIIYIGTAPEPSGTLSARFESADDGEYTEVCPDCLGHVLESEMAPSGASETTLEEHKVCPDCNR